METTTENHVHDWVNSAPCECCKAFKRVCKIPGCEIWQLVDGEGIIRSIEKTPEGEPIYDRRKSA